MLKFCVLTHDTLIQLYKNDIAFQKFMNIYVSEYAGKIRPIDNINNLIKYDKQKYISYKNDYYCIVGKHKHIYISITFAIQIHKLIDIFKFLSKKYLNYWYLYGTFVLTDLRGLGINVHMYNKLKETVKSDKFICMIAVTNNSSIKSYTQLKFKMLKYKTPYDNTFWYAT